MLTWGLFHLDNFPSKTPCKSGTWTNVKSPALCFDQQSYPDYSVNLLLRTGVYISRTIKTVQHLIIDCFSNTD